MRPRRVSRRLWLLIWLVAFLIAAQPGFAAHNESGSRSIETSWDCVDATLAFLVDPERVGRYVPDRFTVQEIGGQALLGIVAEDCTTTVDGGEQFRHVLSAVTVKIDDPASADSGLNLDTDDFYDLLWGTDSTAYHSAAAPLGFVTYIPKSRFALTQVGGQANFIEAEIPWRESPFFLSVSTGEPPETPFDNISVHWGVGPHGLVRSTYVHKARVATGIGRLRVEPGTMLADILGADEVTAPALLLRFTIEDAVSELVPQ